MYSYMDLQIQYRIQSMCTAMCADFPSLSMNHLGQGLSKMRENVTPLLSPRVLPLTLSCVCVCVFFPACSCVCTYRVAESVYVCACSFLFLRVYVSCWRECVYTFACAHACVCVCVYVFVCVCVSVRAREQRMNCVKALKASGLVPVMVKSRYRDTVEVS